MPNHAASSDPATREIFGSIRRGRSRDLLELVPQQVADAAAQDPNGFALALRGLGRWCTPGVEPKQHDPEPILEFLDRTAPLTKSPHVDYLRATADLYQALLDVDIPHALLTNRTDAPLSAVDTRINQAPARHEGEGAALARSNVQGKIHSLADRDEAAPYFADLRERDQDGVIASLYSDLGAMTYFGHDDVETAAREDGPRSIRSTIRKLGGQAPTNRTSIVVSVDPRFFRIYAPHLYFCAQQLPEIDMSILLCGTAGQAKELMSDGHRYLKALAALNGTGYPDNLAHYFIPVPKTVLERRTFYAAARFFAAPVLLQDYRNLYLMDADLAVDAHPGPFLKKVRDLPVAVPKSAGASALSPWRRFMAGNIPLSRRAMETGFLDDLQNYLFHGMARRNSWMLDQNALSYAVERFDGDIEDVNDYSRPFRTMRFMSTWEANFRRSTVQAG